MLWIDEKQRSLGKFAAKNEPWFSSWFGQCNHAFLGTSSYECRKVVANYMNHSKMASQPANQQRLSAVCRTPEIRACAMNSCHELSTAMVRARFPHPDRCLKPSHTEWILNALDFFGTLSEQVTTRCFSKRSV